MFRETIGLGRKGMVIEAISGIGPMGHYGQSDKPAVYNLLGGRTRKK